MVKSITGFLNNQVFQEIFCIENLICLIFNIYDLANIN